MARVFISYAHEDADKAHKIQQRLEALSFGVWIDRKAPATTDDISTVVDGLIAEVDCVLVLWSKHARNSVWVRGEALKGLEANKYFGLLLDPLVPPVPFNAMAAPDLTDWSGLHDHLGWDALVRGLASASKTRDAILSAFDKEQRLEREEIERAARTQQGLPLDAPAEEPLDVGETDDDVDAIIAAAKTILGGAGKLDLSGALAQAALDQEMLRDAAFVVCHDGVGRQPSGARFKVVRTLKEAAHSAQDGDLIVIAGGAHEAGVRIEKSIRIVGLGSAMARPVLTVRGNKPVLTFAGSARAENLVIETRQPNHAIYFEKGRPAVLRCDIRRFSEARDAQDGAVYVAGKSNPTMIASSIASTGCQALYFVSSAGGEFLGVSVIALRAAAIICRGRPTFQGCSVEAIGGHAIDIRNAGHPTFESCEISGRGASVVSAQDQSYPRIRESRITAIRQLAFDFEDSAAGRYEGNIVAVECDPDAGTGRGEKNGFFALLRSKDDSRMKAAARVDEYARLRGAGRPTFVSNTTPNGEVLREPKSAGS